MADEDGKQLELGAEEEEAKPEPVSVEDFNALKEKLEASDLAQAELRGRLQQVADAPAPAAQAAETREHTRDELQGMVDSGTITEGQRDDVLEKQSEHRLDKKLDARDAANRGQSMLETEFSKYREGHPGIEQVGTPDHTLLQAEYTKLIRSGFPDGLHTQITALRGVFGAAEKIPERRRVGDTTREGGAGGDTPADGGDGDGSLTKGLSPRHAQYVNRMVDRGIYTKDSADLKDYIQRARGSAGAGH